MLRDEHRLQRSPVRVRPSPDDADDLHDGEGLLLEVTQQAVLPLSQATWELLQGVDRAVQVHEPDDVPVDAAGDLHDAWVVPRRERDLPGQIEEVGMTGPGRELQTHGSDGSRGSDGRAGGRGGRPPSVGTLEAMPELPDVEAFRRYLSEHAVGQRIERIEAPEPDVIRNTTPQGLGRSLTGRSFGSPDRHGKWVLAITDDGDGPTVVMHFGMTGYLTWSGRGGDRDEHDRVVFVCQDGELRFNLTRMFGGVWLARDGSELQEVTGELGPDAADLDRDDLADLLADRRGGTKSALMDQELVAGIGNIVADETLWRARLHPRQPVPELTEGQIDDLSEALQEVLARSVDHGQVPRRDAWLTHARDVDHADCPRCGTDLEKTEVNSRPTYLCPSCQPAPDDS